jgi:hypothetical protein
MRRLLVVVGLTGGALLLSAVSLELFPEPFIWAGLAWSLALLGLSLLPRGAQRSRIWSHLMAIVLAFTCCEGYLWFKAETQPPAPPAPPEPIITGDYATSGYYFNEHDEVLGFSANKPLTAHAVKLAGDQVLYDVHYTIAENGLRIAPPEAPEIEGCVLFLGDSFTFGEGLNDDEALPYQVGLQSQGAWRVYNLAFHGYGPHQMLSELEHGLVEKLISCDPAKPLHAIYQSIPDHVARAAGFSTWDPHGPRYVLKLGGEVAYRGHFDERFTLPKPVTERLLRSRVYVALFGPNRPLGDRDLELFLGIVAKSEKELRRIHPNAQFHVITWFDLWDDPTTRQPPKMLAGLKARGIDARPIEAIFPDYYDDVPSFHIHGDGHPNAETNKALAGYLLEEVLKWKGATTATAPEAAPAASP